MDGWVDIFVDGLIDRRIEKCVGMYVLLPVVLNCLWPRAGSELVVGWCFSLGLGVGKKDAATF